MADNVSVYVVEDQDNVRACLVEVIEAGDGLTVAGSSCSRQAAFDEIVRLRPQVAVLDGNLGDVDGLVLCRKLRTAAPEVACVVLSAGVGAAWGEREAIEAGAAAFVLKALIDFPLLEVIRRVASGNEPA